MLFRNISFFLLFFFKGVVGNDVRIKSVDGFKNFVTKVNSGTTHSGTTVFLDSDLSLSDETIGPIGDDYPNYFLGTFDGQGNIISDLKMNASSSFSTGLFGYSTGLTIRNVVLDSSCSITTSFDNLGIVYIGGIIGECYADGGECNIENSVNMADVSFSGDADYSLSIGGIAGRLPSSSYPTYVKNCVNYGSVTHSGASSFSYIGGIAGVLSGSGSKYKYLYNCLNYGTITHNGTTSNTLSLGGIAGYSDSAFIENCVSAEKISTRNTPSEDSHVGSIAGQVSPGTSINYCYCTSDLSEYDLYGTGTPSRSSYTLSYDNTTFELSETVSVGKYTGNSLINVLNAYSNYYSLRDYSNWLLNKKKKSVTFIINSRASPITMDYQIILLPSLASEGSISFDGWYNDSERTFPLKSFEIIEDKILYGRFEKNTNNYTIAFGTRREGVSVSPKSARFLSVVSLPTNSARKHCSVAWWETEYGDNVGFSLTMPARNFTLYAVWKCTRIETPDDFVGFSKVVNSGTTYSGTTVFLDADLSLSGEILDPIGCDYSNYFNGVFDGQGHIISDLKMNSFSFLEFTGLFGYSEGLTIRNVVLDSSCSITSLYSSLYSVYIGGFIGECYASNGQCNIENTVNMADVTFSGTISSSSSYLHLGGIAGELYSSSYVKNCANYGSVIHSRSSSNSYIGGIAGVLYAPSSKYAFLYNCLNYGTITHNGTTTYLRLGGVAGESSSTYIENCVSAGEIYTQSIPQNSYIGSIVGRVSSYTSIIHCYYTSNVGGYPINGTGAILNTTGTPTSATAVNSSLVDKLNNHASDNGWNEWLLNMNNAPVTFKVNDYAGFTLNSQIILLPTLAVNDGNNFTGWYEDNSFKKAFSSSSISSDITLYGQLIIKEQKYYSESTDSSDKPVNPSSILDSSDKPENPSSMPDSSGKSANHAGVLNPFMQLVYFLL